MKKIVSILLVLLMSMSIYACGSGESTEPEGMISMKGTYAGILFAEGNDDIHTPDGYVDLVLVFDFINDETNRILPELVSDATLTINETNSYQANENVSHEVYSHGTSKTYTNYGYFEKYTGYKYAVGYGELLGGAEPARMFCHFYVNPNDLSEDGNMVFTFGDQQVEIENATVEEITVFDEILKAGENFEHDQSLASFKWRLDNAFLSATWISEINSDAFGSQCKSLSRAMENTFREDIPMGISVINRQGTGFTDVNGVLFSTKALYTNLPTFDLELVKEAYPEMADQIVKFIEDYTELSGMIAKSGSSASKVEKAMNDVRAQYAELCEQLNMECAVY